MRVEIFLLFGFFLALNWDLFQGKDVGVDGPAEGDIPKGNGTKKYNWPQVDKEKMKERFGNMSTKSKEFGATMSKFGGQFNKFTMCMGGDFLKKCKIQIAMCALLPIPQVCLFGMTCGGKNVKKCYGQVYGNATVTTVAPAGAGGVNVATAPPEPVEQDGMAEAR